MLAYRALGFGLSKHVAWDFGVALSLVVVALTVVAVAYLGRNASGPPPARAARRGVLDRVAAARRPDRGP